jgi:hypothetical protein
VRALPPNFTLPRSLQKKFLAGVKNPRFLSMKKMPDFIGWNAVFFTKMRKRESNVQGR